MYRKRALAAGNVEDADQFAASADDLLHAITPARPAGKRPPLIKDIAGPLDRAQTTLAILRGNCGNGSRRVGELSALARSVYEQARVNAARGDDAGARIEATRADSIARAAARVEIATQ